MRKNILLLTIFVSLFSAISCTNCDNKKAKYVFYFIGDGMGFSHIAAAEYYKAYQESGEIGNSSISFTKFPVMGMASSYSASNVITCSSAAGTALSSGVKTNNGFLGVTPDSAHVKSIAYKIHESGVPVGILTTVSIDHATPGAFYANSLKRSDYYSIATQIANSGFEFFAGGGFISPTGKNKDQRSAYDIVEEGNYTIAAGLEEFNAKKCDSEKIILLQNSGRESRELPYAIDRKDGDLTLSDLVSSAIEFLESQNGFFMMAEGGRIDWSAHSNDGKTTILEVLDLADAVEVAYQFYLKHKDETLIVVTADHETGGIALGQKSGYNMFFDKLDPQVSSKDNSVSATSYEGGTDKAKAEVDRLNQEARIGWTTSSHTAGNVPIFAIGAGSELFAGKMDNTDIPKKICQAMKVAF